ncbi:pectinesterase inhibitor 7-like [Mangifera indica]|uniref:pectinesterase inhibitor 7-like n=1 Tax=Mangifera indica TaxID=29780 RepID=UPI001CFBD3B5|nr:pectinesterase inhibitor 7-like [Mangifera indica]
MNKNTLRPLFLLPLLFSFNLRSVSALNLNDFPSVDFITSPSPGSQPLTNGSDFIRSSCKCTDEPDLCYASLEPYSRSVNRDLAKLSIAAIGVSLEKVKTMVSYLANLSRDADHKSDPRMLQDLRLCLRLIGGANGAVDEIQKSMKQMRDLGSAGSSKERLRFLLFDVQMSITGASIDHSTCIDNFDDVDGPLKEDVIARIAYVRKYLRIALGLVDCYSDKVTS